ncbi:hypothetical protein ABT033_31495 [Streptomyces pharetrae]|uniref:hypothetical protein n=1 Tax=Streptomyces pharetrae TaxID=291370 RepID=UPI00335E7A95
MKLSTIASSLLLACSLAFAGSTLAYSAQDSHNQADSAWGWTVAAEGDGAAEGPSLAVASDAQKATAADSAWG